MRPADLEIVGALHRPATRAACGTSHEADDSFATAGDPGDLGANIGTATLRLGVNIGAAALRIAVQANSYLV
jgi:hypothetical protein